MHPAPFNIITIKLIELFTLIKTSDGSHTIFVPELNEHYHSVHGAVQESTIIFIQNGFKVCQADPLNILEVGFGTGLNALLTAVECSTGTREVNYTSIEKYPLDKKIISSLNHHDFAGEQGRKIFNMIHSAPWNIRVNIHNNFNLKKVEADFTTAHLSGSYDLIYFDAFGPDKQPEMWTLELFSGIAAVTNKNGILVTFSAKGEVKRNLKACGFDVTLLPGPPGKRQMIRAVKI
jgi:tRNA U34 5-methylaminomethyl-2-thiouridine-forming methyltransferase MnmC